MLHLLGLAVLFVLSAFFSGSETALMAIDRLRLRYLVQKKYRHAERLEALLSNPDRLLGGILVGNNLANIAASVFATTLLVDMFGERAELLTILILTPVILIFAEITPKSYAAQHPEKISLLVLRPILAILWLLAPVIWLVTGFSRAITHFFSQRETRPIISEDEIRTMISVGEDAGVVPKEQRQMLMGVFELTQVCVRDVMIPRTEMVAIEVDTPFRDVMAILRQSQHSRFPVYEESLDSIIGIIHAKDVLGYVGRDVDFSLRNIARAPYFVPESKRIGTLLQSFRKKRVHLAVVVDEYGGAEGIVTLEDIVEEIVGEIRDEYDAEEILYSEIGPGVYLIDGSISLRALNRRFGLSLAEEHANTIAGFLLRTMGTIPQVGDSCTSDGTLFTVRKVVDRRIEEIEMRLPDAGSEQ
ncbi:MAG: CNNM domain-containing protein [Desulfuromonadales bacterium]